MRVRRTGNLEPTVDVDVADPPDDLGRAAGNIPACANYPVGAVGLEGTDALIGKFWNRLAGARSLPHQESKVDPLDTQLEALDVQVVGGEVVLLGPRVAVALTAAAAAETARRLAAAATEAAKEKEGDNSAQASQALSPDA